MNWLQAIFTTIGSVLLLDPAVYARTLTSESPFLLALLVLITCGLSYSLGQSGVLLANRVPPGRFVIALFGGSLVVVGVVGLWTFTITLIVRFLQDIDVTFAEVFVIVAISFAPFIFGIMVFLPYLGHILAMILRLWTFLALVIGLNAVYQFSYFQAALIGGLGWLIFELLLRLPVLRLDRVGQAVLDQASGRHLETAAEIAAQLPITPQDAQEVEEEQS